MSSTQPKISVVIPVYNTGALASQLVQEILTFYKNLEIILIDDGSTDDSFLLLKKQLAESIKHKQVKLIKQQNQGASCARNQGIARATGQYISFIDSDDKVTADFFRTLVEQFNNPKIRLAGCGYSFTEVKLDKSHNKFCDSLPLVQEKLDWEANLLRYIGLDGRLYGIINKMFILSEIERANLRFQEKMRFGEDLDFVVRYLLMSDNNEQISWVQQPLYHYFYGTKTSLAAKTALDWQNWMLSFQKLVTAIDNKPLNLYHYLILLKILLRWRISHALAVRRSGMSLSERMKKSGILWAGVGSLAFLVLKILKRR